MPEEFCLEDIKTEIPLQMLQKWIPNLTVLNSVDLNSVKSLNTSYIQKDFSNIESSWKTLKRISCCKNSHAA